jgi:hypothetical protein
MSFGDGIRRNIAHVEPRERDALRDAIREMHRRFYPGSRSDSPPGGVSWWFKQCSGCSDRPKSTARLTSG